MSAPIRRGPVRSLRVIQMFYNEKIYLKLFKILWCIIMGNTVPRELCWNGSPVGRRASR